MNVLQSYQFFGAMLVLGLLYRLSWQEQQSRAGMGFGVLAGLGRTA